jgi:hypothetical protein
LKILINIFVALNVDAGGYTEMSVAKKTVAKRTYLYIHINSYISSICQLRLLKRNGTPVSMITPIAPRSWFAIIISFKKYEDTLEK